MSGQGGESSRLPGAAATAQGESELVAVGTRELKASGFELLDLDPALPLLALALTLGRPVPSAPGRGLSDMLSPRSQIEANPRSLSGMYGTGAFPWHTEDAHWRMPPRYFLLRLAAPVSVSRPTLLLDRLDLELDDDQWRDVATSIWYTRGGRGTFLTPMLNRTLRPDTPVFRYDRHAIAPASRHAQEVGVWIDRALDAARPIELRWALGKVLVVDNWRVLHARGTSQSLDTERVLERMLIE